MDRLSQSDVIWVLLRGFTIDRSETYRKQIMYEKVK